MQVEPGKILKGKVSGITNFGAFVDLEDGATGLVHISEISNEYVKDIHDHVKVGQEVEVKVLPNEKGNKLSLSIKQVMGDNADSNGEKKDKKSKIINISSYFNNNYYSDI